MSLPNGFMNDYIKRLHDKQVHHHNEMLKRTQAFAYLEGCCEQVIESFQYVRQHHSDQFTHEMRYVLTILTDGLKKAREIEGVGA